MPARFFAGCTLHKSGVGGYSTSPCTDEQLTGSVKVADLNGDGVDDVVSRSTLSNSLLVLMNDGAGNFAKFPMSDSANDSPAGLTAYDWNADGKMDLVNSFLHSSGDFWVRLGNGDGAFGPKISIPGAPWVSIPIELTGDGRTDLITQECHSAVCTPALLIGADASSAAAPTIIAFSPNAGVQPAGKIVNFTATLQDPAGANNVKALEVEFGGHQPCFFSVNVASNSLEVFGKSVPVGTDNVLIAAYCALFSQNATITKNGNNVQIRVPMQFLANAPVQYAAYARIHETSGTTTIPVKVGEFSAAPTATGQTTLTSITPASGTGNAQTFHILVEAPASNFVNVSLLLAPTLNGAHACLIEVGPYVTKILSDAGNEYAQAETGSAGTVLSNSQCSVNPGAVTVRPNESVWTIDLPITFKAAFVGAKKLYIALNNTGVFVERGTFEVTAGPQAPAGTPA